MVEQRMCPMTVYAGRADSQSLAELNRLLDEGWRISGIDPTLHRVPGVGSFKAFVVELMKPPENSEQSNAPTAL